MSAIAPRVTAVVPRGRRLTGPVAAVRTRVEQLRREAAAAGVAIEITPLRWLPDGTAQVDVEFLPQQPVRRQIGPKVWVPAAAIGLLLLAGCGWMVVQAVQAITRTVAEALPYAAGALVIIAALIVAGAVRGGGTFSGTFKGRMD